MQRNRDRLHAKAGPCRRLVAFATLRLSCTAGAAATGRHRKCHLVRFKAAAVPLVVLILMLGFAPRSKAACLDWSRWLNEPANRLATYTGPLGRHRIRMALHLDVATWHFDGGYGYNDQPGTLQLTGRMRPGGVGLDLVARDQQGKVVGYFSLAFFEPRRNWSGSWDFFEKQMKSSPTGCNALTGTWQPVPSDSTYELVTLQAGTPIDPADDIARKRNEETAYKLQQAMLHNNKQAFADLLKYPFRTYDSFSAERSIKIWNTSKDVIHNYDKIVPSTLLRYEARDAIPHFIPTTDAFSSFMNGFVYIEHGKVTWICAGACPPR